MLSCIVCNTSNQSPIFIGVLGFNSIRNIINRDIIIASLSLEMYISSVERGGRVEASTGQSMHVIIPHRIPMTIIKCLDK